MDLPQALGAVIRQLREKKGLSMDGVQSQFGIPKINQTRWENAKIQISLVSLESYMRKVHGIKASDAVRMAEEMLEKKG